jgi:CheY-like chemotaxis protein
VHDDRDILESWGHEAQCVYSPGDALERIAGFQPGTLLLDIGLPGMNGYELAGAVRQLPQAEAMPLVAIAGYGDAEARRLIAEAGYDWHLTKPVDPDTLEQLLATRRPSAE